MLRCQVLCHVLKALFFIKIALKLSFICKKMQNLRALGASPLCFKKNLAIKKICFKKRLAMENAD